MKQQQELTPNRPVVQRKIPLSLSVVSYIFFTLGLVTGIGGCVRSLDTRTDLPLSSLITIVFAVLYVFISRGLRRCSRGWYICAVIIAFVAPIWTICLTVYYFLSIDLNTKGTFPFAFLFIMIFAFLIEVWIFQVLTRKDVRALFDLKRTRAT
jgi:hypothetical protein